MPLFAGWQKYLNLAAETVWGTTPGVPSWFYYPYETYDVSVKPNVVQAELFTGLRMRRMNRLVSYALDGTLASPLYGIVVDGTSLAEILIEAAISAPRALELDSLVAEINEETADNKRHNGLRINTFTLSGENQGTIKLSAALIGKTETGGITMGEAIDETQAQPLEFLFSDATLTIDSVEVNMRSFNLEVNNQLQPNFVNDVTISHLTNGIRQVQFTFDLFKTDDTYDALRRSTSPSESVVNLELKGDHGGTGGGGTTYTVVDIDFDRVSLTEATDTAGLNELASISTGWIVLKPDTTNDEIRTTYSEVA